MKHAYHDLRAYFEQLQTNRVTGYLEQTRVLERRTLYHANEYIGERSEPQPQLIGTHCMTAGTVGEKA